MCMTGNFRLCAFADEASPDLDGQIRALGENHIGYIELRGVDGKNVSALSTAEAREVRKKLDAAGISVWSIGSPTGKTNICDSFDDARDGFARIAEIAEITGAQCIRMFSFYGTDESRSCFDEVCRRIDSFIELSKGCGARLCHENEKKIYGDTPEHCLRLLEALPGLTAVFDPANFVQCGADPLAAWEMLGSHVFYAHIKDADKSGANLPAGRGVGRIPELLPRFREAGIEVLTLEPHLTHFTGLSKLENGAKHTTGAEYHFSDCREAFDFACASLRGLLCMAE